MKRIITLLSFSLSISLFAQTVNIPDTKFKKYLLGESTINLNGDTEISLDEASNEKAIYVDCSYLGISDLTGIEAFTALKYLECVENNLTSIDVTKNTNLLTIDIRSNQVSSIDVSKNLSLTRLFIGTNKFSSIDISKNTLLEDLDCVENEFTSTNINNNKALKLYRCSNNSLGSINVTNHLALETLECSSIGISSLDVTNNTKGEVLILLYDNGEREKTILK